MKVNNCLKNDCLLQKHFFTGLSNKQILYLSRLVPMCQLLIYDFFERGQKPSGFGKNNFKRLTNIYRVEVFVTERIRSFSLI